MAERKETGEPIRNQDGEVVSTSFSECPKPEFTLDPLHRTLLLTGVTTTG